MCMSGEDKAEEEEVEEEENWEPQPRELGARAGRNAAHPVVETQLGPGRGQ